MTLTNDPNPKLPLTPDNQQRNRHKAENYKKGKTLDTDPKSKTCDQNATEKPQTQAPSTSQSQNAGPKRYRKDPKHQMQAAEVYKQAPNCPQTQAPTTPGCRPPTVHKQLPTPPQTQALKRPPPQMQTPSPPRGRPQGCASSSQPPPPPEAGPKAPQREAPSIYKQLTTPPQTQAPKVYKQLPTPPTWAPTVDKHLSPPPSCRPQRCTSSYKPCPRQNPTVYKQPPTPPQMQAPKGVQAAPNPPRCKPQRCTSSSTPPPDTGPNPPPKTQAPEACTYAKKVLMQVPNATDRPKNTGTVPRCSRLRRNLAV
ncbi:extensin-like isoform X2 [Cygnus olor]|uniref:extensin-like isoform X2 n=1 Tax=Cygnus olor TaxID=8869 RepID=UPI001ADE1FB6|nr:extensin-like isoform X2 [Cygnus olor]